MEDGKKIIEQYKKQMKGLREKIKKLEEKNKKLESDASWRWEYDLQESRRRNEMGRQGIFG